MVEQIERTRHQHADGGTARQATTDGECHVGDVDMHTAHLVPLEHIGGYTGTIAEEGARLGHLLQLLIVHPAGKVVPHIHQLRGITGQLKHRGFLHLGIDAMLDTCNDGHTRQDVGIHRTVVTRPVGMLTEQTEPSWHKQFQHEQRVLIFNFLQR